MREGEYVAEKTDTPDTPPVADPVTEDGRARLEAIAATKDGFQIAEKDLEIRGPGELFGARQSGLAPFRVADLPLLQMARRDAKAWIEENPTLSGERDALLRKRLLKAHGEALGLGDVALREGSGVRGVKSHEVTKSILCHGSVSRAPGMSPSVWHGRHGRGTR